MFFSISEYHLNDVDRGVVENYVILWTEPSVCPQVTIDISSVGFIPLYGSSDKQKILALFSPTDPLTAVALYLLHQWWAVDNILKTADLARDGAVEV